jgi:hypothetical protein
MQQGLVACVPQGGFSIMVEIEGRCVTFTPAKDVAYLMGGLLVGDRPFEEK